MKVDVDDPEWLQAAWVGGIGQTINETKLGLDDFPRESVWTREQLLDQAFLPD